MREELACSMASSASLDSFSFAATAAAAPLISITSVNDIKRAPAGDLSKAVARALEQTALQQRAAPLPLSATKGRTGFNGGEGGGLT